MVPYLSLIIPAYNEAVSIGRTLGTIQAYLDTQAYGYEIIVAADGDDGTREIVAARAAETPPDGTLCAIGNLERRGKGRGVREGVARARGDIIGFVDADNKTPIEELAKVLPWFERGYDVVIGSRGRSDSNVERRQPVYRRIGSRAFRIVMRLMIGLWAIKDTQCGFKFFRGDVAHDLFRHQQIDGYMFDVEVLHLAMRRGYRIKEVGVRWHDGGDTRFNPLGGTVRNAKELMRIRLATLGKPQPSPAPETALAVGPEAGRETKGLP